MAPELPADLSGYLARIGIAQPQGADLDSLQTLITAHTRAIPFENLDPLLGIPVADLSAAALGDKLVGRRRGGYCYEHNGLFGYVLEQLGFGVSRLAARVVWMKDRDAPLPALTHTVLAVTVPRAEARYLVDVGFGGQTPTSPLRLEAGPVQQTRHEPYRLLENDEGYVLATQLRGEWKPLYVFTTTPQPRIDLEVGSWYVSTYPKSIFVVGLTAALVVDDARFNLRGRNLALHRGGETERIRFDSAVQVLDELTGRFGIDLDELGKQNDIEARVNEVLDT